MSKEKQGKFTIKDLERLTGIKAHTLRVWEQRYAIIEPKRTDTNIRFFDEDDLKYILNIAMLNSNGMRISKIAELSKAEINQRVLTVSEQVQEDSDLLTALTITMLDLDEQRFEKILSNVIIKLGFKHAVTKVIYPFMYRIGILWQTGSIVPAQEHFISNLVRHKLIVAADNMMAKKNENPKKFVLFLPEGELHEIGLLFANYLFKIEGHRTIYLGQTVPLEDLSVIADVYKPDYYFTVLTYETGIDDVKDYVDALSKLFKGSKVLIAGTRVEESQVKQLWNNIVFVNDLNEIETFLKKIA
ncbi:MerR family transcriptional regulator [bacterium]|nr:MerR family transcriptional regulator [bacterium]